MMERLATLEVVAIAPHYAFIWFDGVITNETGVRYRIGFQHAKEGATIMVLPAGAPPALALGTKNKYFTLVGVQGDAVNPNAVIIKVEATNEEVSISRSKPLKCIIGYVADIKFEPEKRIWMKRRPGDKLAFAGEECTINAISENEIVLSTSSGNSSTLRGAFPAKANGTQAPAEGSSSHTNTPTGH